MMNNLRKLGLALSSVIASGFPLSAQGATYHHPVKVLACDADRGHFMLPGYIPGYYPPGPYFWSDVYGYRYHQDALGGNPTLGIDYVNETATTMKEIEFGLVARGRLVAEVRDVGTFSPGVQIKHKFGLSPNVFPLRTAFARCVPLRIRFASGAAWKNPHLPALRRSIYNSP